MFWDKKKKYEKDTFVVVNDCAMHCKEGMLPGRDERCPKWVILNMNYIVEDKPTTKQEGKCAIAWIPTLLVELRQSLDRQGVKNATT